MVNCYFHILNISATITKVTCAEWAKMSRRNVGGQSVVLCSHRFPKGLTVSGGLRSQRYSTTIKGLLLVKTSKFKLNFQRICYEVSLFLEFRLRLYLRLLDNYSDSGPTRLRTEFRY